MLLKASKIYVAIAPPHRPSYADGMGDTRHHQHRRANHECRPIGAAKLEQPEEHQHQRHVFGEVGSTPSE